MTIEHTDKRPILYDYFRDSTNVLLAEYERSKGQEASANIGYNRELFCNKFLSCVLPPRLTVRRGEIWDSRGNRTGQLDVVILREDTPSLTFGEADAFLAEGVFGVIEVKSNLTTTKLEEALTTLKRVKALSLSGGGAIITAGPVLNRPLRCVFAYEGATWGTLLQELAKPENATVLDLICILNSGALISCGLLLNWEGDAPFYICEGKAASLAWLYFHLVSYSTSFMGRTLSIVQYFEPLNGWGDSGGNFR
jgi:hypothetical protein